MTRWALKPPTPKEEMPARRGKGSPLGPVGAGHSSSSAGILNGVGPRFKFGLSCSELSRWGKISRLPSWRSTLVS